MSKVPYLNAVGSLMYAMVCTYPKLAYSFSMVNRYICNLRKVHQQVVKKILRDLRRTSRLGLLYGDGLAKGGVVEGFLDLDFGGDVDKRKSLIGYVLTAWGSAIS